MIVVLKLIANLRKRNNFGVRVQSLTESGKSKLAEALATLISVDSAKALVTMGELGRYKKVHDIFRNLTRNTQKHVI